MSSGYALIRHGRRRHLAGFTLLELTLALLLIGLLISLGTLSLGQVNDAMNRERTKTLLEQIETAVNSFAAGNYRLPCPDTDGDGVENCAGGAIGTIPWQTLERDGHIADAFGRQLAYAVYRNGGDDADLAVLGERKDAINGLSVTDRLDFCQALDNAAGAALSLTFASVSTQRNAVGCTGAGDYLNVAYLLASGGASDADEGGNGSFYDYENNDAIAPCFASPERLVDDSYDDLLTSVSFSELSGKLCIY